ncbi:MAG: hypothetical protein ABSC71_10230 [Candidatus Acidiferrales bacterium]
MFDDDAFGRVVPFAFVVDQGAGANGVENAGGGGRDGFGALGDVDGGETDVGHTFVEKPGGVGVTVDRGGFEIVLVGDALRAKPVKKVEFDIGAMLVTADGAFSGVAFERGGFASGEGTGSPAVGGGTGKPAGRAFRVGDDCGFGGGGICVEYHFCL